MNKWNKIWSKRSTDIILTDDAFDMFCKLKRADGFDTQDISGYYEAFLYEWERMSDKILKQTDGFSSIYEVGCGSGVNLYLFQKLKGISVIGGCDYSDALIEMANKVLKSDDILCEPADKMSENPVYDVVLSDSVFQYFESAEYGLKVLGHMWNKAGKMVVITEIHDESMKNEHLAYRRSCVENYDEKYKNLDKTFYTKDMFIDFAKKVGAKCEIVKPQNELYWNNKYVFDCYLSR